MEVPPPRDADIVLKFRSLRFRGLKGVGDETQRKLNISASHPLVSGFLKKSGVV